MSEMKGETDTHLVLIQPDMCQPQGVVRHGVLAFGRSIWPPFSENVSYSRARDDEELPTTHPDLARSKPTSVQTVKQHTHSMNGGYATYRCFSYKMYSEKK